MMFEASLKNALGPAFSIDQVKGYVPWHPSVKNKANQLFNKLFSSAGTQANYFSLLGWETGMILSEIVRQHLAGNTNATHVVRSLTGIALESPRGWLKIDPVTQHSYGPSYLAAYHGNEVVVADEDEKIEEKWRTFTSQKDMSGESSAWRNTYLCI
jgi:hypothetical protein